jgi:ribosomal-protein-alanine N-acetyltransferase
MLRKISQSDVSQLCAIETATQLAPWPQETFEKCFQAKSQGWVIAQTENKLIGFILVLVQASECHVLNICVDPNYQRQGHGTQLILQVFSEMKKQNINRVYLEVRCSNENAITLYEKLGFKKLGERKDYYSAAEGREDAWVFAKDL